jgi:hypothetical protein
MSNTPFFNYFSKEAEILLQYFERSKQQSANVNIGANREAFVNKFVNKILPLKLRVAAGEIIDHKGHRTGQLDTIITNHSAAFLDYGEENTYLAGGVFAVIEIKSFLDSDKFLEANATLSKLSTLEMPLTRILMGYEYPSGIDVFKIIFAYSGRNLTTIGKYLMRSKTPNLIDMVCVLDRGILIKRSIIECISDEYTQFETLSQIPGYVVINSSAAALAFLYSTIIQFGNTYLGGREAIEPYLLNSEDTWNS